MSLAISSSEYDVVDGKQIAHRISSGHTDLDLDYTGSIRVVSGLLRVLALQDGSLRVCTGASVRVLGRVFGSVYVEQGGSLHVAPGAKVVGSLHNDGEVVVHGIYGGKISGHCALKLVGEGCIRPFEVIENSTYSYSL